jgi:hypothetical protein
MSSTTTQLHPDENVRLGKLGPSVFRISLTIGVLSLLLTLVMGLLGGDGMRRFFFSYLLGFSFFLTLALGALFFTTIQHLVRATWSVVVRRIAEAMTGTFPLLFALSLVILVPMLLGHTGLYSWSDPEVAANSYFVSKKTGYLNVPFFALRVLIYFGVWMAIAHYFFHRSVEQDESGDPALSERMRVMAAPAIIGFALTANFAAFDLWMSLEPEWFSSIYGVYIFAGAMITVFAVLILASMGLQQKGRLVHSITTEHYHDLGKFLFAFVFFWGYIAFSQFMLIWYANIPEETFWYHIRIQGPWMYVSLALLFLHFMLPFAGLISRHPKRRRATLALLAAWMLAMHWIDLYWLILPTYDGDAVPFHLMDITATLGVGGLFVAMTVYMLSRVNLLPTRDPNLSKSLEFENI